MIDLLALADFTLVATHGGFGRASRASGRPKATLSRRVADLEASLGVRLIERGVRSLRLTEAGTLLHGRAGPLLAEIDEAAAAASATLDRPRGLLRVSAPILLAHMLLGRVAAAFVAAYPEVRMDVVAEDRLTDPVEDGYDVVLRVNPRPDDRLIGRCVLRDAQWLVAVPSIARPADGELGDGATVRAVVRTAVSPGTGWRVRDGDRRFDLMPEPVVRLSSLHMVRDAVLAGAGAAVLPCSMVAADVAAGRLARWGVADAPPAEIWAMHTSRRLVSAKVSAFLTFLSGIEAEGFSRP